MRFWDRPALILGLLLAALYAGLAYAQPSHGVRARPAASSSYWMLHSAQCGSAQQPAGQGCWDKSGDPSWSVNGESATYTQPTFNGHFTWTVPSTIPTDGTGAVTLGVQANDTGNNSGYKAQICVSGDFGVQESGSPCATAYAMAPAPSSASDSKTFNLLGNSNSFSTGEVDIGFGSGYVHFFYTLVTPPPPESPSSPPLSEAQCQKLASQAPAEDHSRPGGAPQAHAAAPSEVHVVAVCPDVQFHKGGTPPDAWLPVEVGTVLKQGDEITCDPDGVVKMAFADNSTVVVRNTTQLKIASFFTEGGVVRTELLLKMGEIAAQVNRSEATKSDFHISPTPEYAGVRGAPDAQTGSSSSASAPGVDAGPGTNFSVFYAPGSNVLVASASQGAIGVTPSNPSLKPVLVSAGDEVEVTPTYESLPGPTGKVGVIGGDDIVAASSLAEAVVGKARKGCHDRTAHSYAFSIAPGTNEWTVSVKLGGRVRGSARFRVTGSAVTPVNALARKLVAGCRASPGHS